MRARVRRVNGTAGQGPRSEERVLEEGCAPACVAEVLNSVGGKGRGDSVRGRC